MQAWRTVLRDGGRLAAFLVVVLLASALLAEQAATPTSGDTESNTVAADRTVGVLVAVPGVLKPLAAPFAL
jgi:hypothetical protein